MQVALKMKLFGIFLVSFLFQLSIANERKVKDDINRACLVRFLQIKGKLDESFDSSAAPPELCRILLPLIYANHSEKLSMRLWETKSVKADCVFEKLNNSEFIDLELKLEIYKRSKRLNDNDKRKGVSETSANLRNILQLAANDCKSDATYGGLFDEILGINSSLITLQENYCLVQFLLQNKFLFGSRKLANPMDIDISTIDCLPVIIKVQDENERKLLEAFRKRKYSGEAIECLLEKYNDEKVFGWNLAKSFLFKLNLSDNVRRSEDWRISKILSDFNKKSSNCLYTLNWALF